MISTRTLAACLYACALLPALGGCGYTKEEWQQQLDAYERSVGQQRKAEARAEELGVELDRARTRVSELEERLRSMGLDLDLREGQLDQLTATLAERERALSEYRIRARQLEDVKARFELLRSKLEALTALGIEVRIRNNRMVVSLPGDVLFDTGKDRLRKEGKEALRKVAEVLRSDPSLSSRDYQVAGHTDSKALRGGAFGDNWGLSVMRSRQVLLFLLDPKEGALPRERWSAAGYADTDPVATNESDEGRQKNRRCEIVLLPSVAEMLDLKAIAARPAARPTP